VGSVPVPASDMNFQGPLITDVETILSETNPMALCTRPVQLANASVQRVLNPQYLLIGPDKQRVVLVRLKEVNRWVRPGQSIKVSGVIMQLGEDRSQWNLGPDARKLIERHGIFINAMN
jgi:hypothetical protein